MASRRGFVKGSLSGMGAALAAFGINPALAQEMGKAAGRSDKPLKAAFSNAGLQATWCAQGKQAAEYWGSLFNVEVTWFDGQLDAVKQRSAIDNMASQKWDFVAVQAFGIGTLTAPLQKLIDARYEFYAADDFPNTRKLSYQQLLDLDVVYAGSPERVAEQLIDLQDRFRFDEFLLIANYGGNARWQAMRNQELFMTKVAPKMREAASKMQKKSAVAAA